MLRIDRKNERERIRNPILRLLRHHFPRWKIARVLSGTDRRRHQTAALLRVLFWEGRRVIAAILIYPGESTELSDRLFSSAIVWWDRLSAKKGASKLVVFLPETWSERLLTRFSRLKIPLECFKYDLRSYSLRQIYPAPVRASELSSPYVIFPYGRNIPPLLGEIKSSYPELDLMYRKGRWELAYLGLRVCWYEEESRNYLFNLNEPSLLERERSGPCEQHLAEVISLRRFPPPRPEHLYYRHGHERWLESLILKNHRLIYPDFADPIYPQVPTCVDGERKVLDLLTKTNRRQLAVLELKVPKDLDLIFQGLDYWERVNHHLAQGDLQRAGYFEGEALSTELPLLFLICPLFEFHRLMPALRRHLTDDVQLNCVGVNSDWKKGVKVLRKFVF